MKVIQKEATAAPQQSIVDAQVAEKMKELMPSPASLRFAELTKDETNDKRIVKVTLESGDWFIRRMNFGEFTRFGLLTPRDEEGNISLEEADNLTAVTTAMLYCCVVNDESGMTNYFSSLNEAHTWAVEPRKRIRDTVGSLFNEILALNPDIIPDGQEEEETELTPEQKEALEKKE